MPEPLSDDTASLANGQLDDVGESLRCPDCQNPIQLSDDRPDEVLCPAYGGSFRVREARRTDTASTGRPLGKIN
jgi:hypothetical protein